MYTQIFLLVNGLALALGVGLISSDRNVGWHITTVAEATWLIWVLWVGLWGVVPSAIALLAMNIRGWYKHRNKIVVHVEETDVSLSVQVLPRPKSDFKYSGNVLAEWEPDIMAERV